VYQQLPPIARAGTLVLLARRVDRLDLLRTELLARLRQLKVVALAADLSNEGDVAGVLTRVQD